MPESVEQRANAQLDRLIRAQAGLGEPLVWEGQLDRLYASGGLPRGSSTGWDVVDELFTVAGHQWTLVTGVPGMGKSEFIDALMVNLAESGRWAFAVYSPENLPVVTHAVKLMEKRARKPFGNGPTERMSNDEMRFAAKWVSDNFTFFDSELGTLMDLVHSGIRLGMKAGRRLGIVIDPWNSLNHYDPSVRMAGMSETEYIASVLGKLVKFVRSDEGRGIHVFLVAHPAKLYRGNDGKYPIPTGYDVAGSAHFFNRADNILCIHRDKSVDTQDVELYVQKVKFKHIGHFGMATLKYDRVTGRYFEWGGPALIDRATGVAERYRDPSTMPREPGSDDA